MGPEKRGQVPDLALNLGRGVNYNVKRPKSTQVNSLILHIRELSLGKGKAWKVLPFGVLSSPGQALFHPTSLPPNPMRPCLLQIRRVCGQSIQESL